MYQVIIKGRTLEELKQAVDDINNELGNGTKIVHNLDKDMADVPDPIDCTAHAVKGATGDGLIKEPVQLEIPLERMEAKLVKIAQSFSADPTPVTIEQGVAIHDVSNVTQELDADGVPWDKRIHTGNRSKVNAGTWKGRRGVDKDLVKQIRQELLAAVELQNNPIAIPAAPISANTPVVEIPTLTVAGPPVTVEAPDSTPTVVQPILATPPTPQLQNASGHSLKTFTANFPLIVGTLISEKKITQEYVNQLKEHFQVTEIWNVTDEQKAEMFEGFVKYGFVQKVA